MKYLEIPENIYLKIFADIKQYEIPGINISRNKNCCTHYPCGANHFGNSCALCQESFGNVIELMKIYYKKYRKQLGIL